MDSQALAEALSSFGLLSCKCIILRQERPYGRD